MSTRTPQTFRIEAIPGATLDRLRHVGSDDFGNPLLPTAVDERGAPLRCCLREAEVHERVALIAHQPAAWLGPYAEVGPVFIHADHCPGYGQPAAYPAGFRHRRQVFRPYTRDRCMAYGALEIVEGDAAEDAVQRIFSDPEIEVIHSRNVLAGCFMFAIGRAGETG